MSNMQKTRSILLLAAFGILAGLSGSAHSGTIDLSLDLYYDSPADDSSAGSWQLVAKASDRGIAGLLVRLADVDANPTFEAPTGSGTGVPVAGFYPTFNGGATSYATDRGDHWELLFAQIPVASPGPQGLLYDVGVVGGATQPGGNGSPAIAGFTVGNNVPWAFNDALGDLLDDGVANQSGSFEGGVLLASGTFGASTSPGFFSGGGETIAGTVFLGMGNANNAPAVGSIVEATITTQVRDNAPPDLLGDVNLDGNVNGLDVDPFVGCLLNGPYQAEADMNEDQVINGLDVDPFVAAVVGSGAVQQIPEPSTFVLGVLGLLGMVACAWRGRRRAV